MILTLKNWRINCENSIVDEVNNRKSAIFEMFRLDDPTLSDDEFLRIISNVYDWDRSDIESVIKEMLNTANPHSGEMVSNVISFPSFLSSNYYYYNSMIGYKKGRVHPYKNPYSFKTKERYSVQELMRMVENQELVLTKTSGVGDIYEWPINEYGRRSVEDDYKIMQIDNMTRQNLRELESYNITKVTLAELGGYKDWLVPMFRRLFTSARIEHDIRLAIKISEYAFDVYENVFAKGNGLLNIALEQTRFLEELTSEQEPPTAYLK